MTTFKLQAPTWCLISALPYYLLSIHYNHIPAYFLYRMVSIFLSLTCLQLLASDLIVGQPQTHSTASFHSTLLKLERLLFLCIWSLVIVLGVLFDLYLGMEQNKDLLSSYPNSPLSGSKRMKVCLSHFKKP